MAGEMFREYFFILHAKVLSCRHVMSTICNKRYLSLDKFVTYDSHEACLPATIQQHFITLNI